MRLLAAVGLTVGLVAAGGAHALDHREEPAAVAGTAQSQPQFHRLLESYWTDFLRLNPALALSVGDYSSQELFDDSLEDSWRARMLEMLKRYSTALAAFDPTHLSVDGRVSYGMLRYLLDRDRGFYGGRLFEVARLMPVDQFQGLHIGYAAEAAGSGAYPFKTVADYDKALTRADNYSRWTDDVIQRLRQGVAQGVVLPQIIVERMLPQLQAHLGAAPDHTQFWHPIESMPASFPAVERERLTAAYRQKIGAVIQPAYRRLHDYLQTEYLPHARQSVGLGQMPGGAALYAYYVRYHTTTDLGPARIHALGLSEVERITAQLAAVQKSVGFKGTLHDFFAHVREDPAQHFGRPED
ncbi:MAG TPA: DUF885 domain-containing protein, partial [Steroidobacteraceae bacterium]